jgi:hypothetical protein
VSSVGIRVGRTTGDPPEICRQPIPIPIPIPVGTGTGLNTTWSPDIRLEGMVPNRMVAPTEIKKMGDTENESEAADTRLILRDGIVDGRTGRNC